MLVVVVFWLMLMHDAAQEIAVMFQASVATRYCICNRLPSGIKEFPQVPVYATRVGALQNLSK
jgi:hypothetical protein